MLPEYQPGLPPGVRGCRWSPSLRHRASRRGHRPDRESRRRVRAGSPDEPLEACARLAGRLSPPLQQSNRGPPFETLCGPERLDVPCSWLVRSDRRIATIIRHVDPEVVAGLQLTAWVPLDPVDQGVHKARATVLGRLFLHPTVRSNPEAQFVVAWVKPRAEAHRIVWEVSPPAAAQGDQGSGAAGPVLARPPDDDLRLQLVVGLGSIFPLAMVAPILSTRKGRKSGPRARSIPAPAVTSSRPMLGPKPSASPVTATACRSRSPRPGQRFGVNSSRARRMALAITDTCSSITTVP